MTSPSPGPGGYLVLCSTSWCGARLTARPWSGYWCAKCGTHSWPEIVKPDDVQEAGW